MEKSELIKRITDIIRDYGSFSIGELEGETSSICSGELGSFVGLLEHFTKDYVQQNIYNPSSFSSDPIDSVETEYEAFNENTLTEILWVVEQWEAECIRTQKRISN